MLSLSASTSPACKHCGSHSVDRLMSKFSSPKSEEARLEALADPDSLEGLDENDPESVGRFMKQIGGEMGEDVGEEVEAMMDSGGIDGSEDSSTDSL